jgi:DNA-binding LytR/AlgR family response regulator
VKEEGDDQAAIHTGRRRHLIRESSTSLEARLDPHGLFAFIGRRWSISHDGTNQPCTA